MKPRHGPALLLALAAAPAASIPSEAAPTGLALTLAPVPSAPRAATIAGLGVTLRFDALAIGAGQPVLRIPLIDFNIDTVATTLSGLTARDARGPVALTAHDVDADDPARIWTADRALSGPLTVHYTVPARGLPLRGPSPPLPFSDDGDGVSAGGNVFLLMPPGDRRYRMTVAWDLAALPKGARGISSLGEGTATAAEPMSAAQIARTYYMAGRINAWPTPVPSHGFFGAWQGKAMFDETALLAWTGKLYNRYVSFFGTAPQRYGVFLRYNPVNAGGGVALHHAFVATFGKGDGSNIDRMRSTLSHEMFHTFQPFLDGVGTQWFAEGLAVFYQARLPLRFGQITSAAFLNDLNFAAARYYTSAMATVPNTEIDRRFWSDTRIRTLPYDRGMLYLATVDDAVRKTSGGKRSLDDLMFAMLAREKNGKSTSNADWEAVLTQELGPGAVTAFRAFLGGTVPLPASDAFGPCFRRVAIPLRRYEVGFDPAVLAEPKRVVRGLVTGSAAARAGLRDGDEIMVPVPQDAIQSNQAEPLTLSLRRADRTFSITYLPRGETVDAWQWQRVPDVPEPRCAVI